jgi:hypothetical protein
MTERAVRLACARKHEGPARRWGREAHDFEPAETFDGDASDLRRGPRRNLVRRQSQNGDLIRIQLRLASSNGVKMLDEVHAPNQRLVGIRQRLVEIPETGVECVGDTVVHER